MRDNFLSALSLKIRGRDKAWDSVEHICYWTLAACSSKKRRTLKELARTTLLNSPHLLPQPSLAYGPVVVRMRAISCVADVLRLLRADTCVAPPPGLLQWL